MLRKIVLLGVLACVFAFGAWKVATPAPVSAATIDVTATCGNASYISGRLQQQFNVTISGPLPTGNQVFTTSGWATNVGTFHYMSTSPSPFSTPYPFSGTMTASYADDVFSPTTPPTNPPPGSTVQYTLGAYVSDPLTQPDPQFYHIGSVVVSCSVPALTDPLKASNFTINTTSGQTFSGELDDHISGGSAPFSFAIGTPSFNGTTTLLTGSPSQTLAGAFTYRTVKGTAGTDSFVYQVSDSTGAVRTGTATINYAAPPALVAPPRTLAVPYQGTNSLTLGSTGGIGTKTISLDTTSPSAKGTFTLTGTSFSYQAANGQSGADTITYRVTDQTDPAQNLTGTITINIAPPPVVANNSTLSVAYESSATGNVASLTTGGLPPLSYTVQTQPTKGTLSLNSSTGAFTYEANDDATGADSFVYRATDSSSTALFDNGTIAITIAPKPLTGSDSTLTVVAGLSAPINVLTLIDGGTAPYTYSSSIPTKGEVNIVGSVYTYTADIDERGADSFTYTVLDSGADPFSQTVTKTISVTIIDPPIVIVQPGSTSVTAGLSTTINLTPNASGGTGSLTYSIQTDGTKGSSTLAGKSLTYTANAADRGTDTVTILVTDESNPAQTKTITVPILNTAPTLIAGDTASSVQAGQSVTIDLTSLISGGTGTFTVSFDEDGTKGTATVSGLTVTYAANAADRGADTVVYRVTDVSNPVQSITGDIGITITAPPLVASPSSQSVTAGETLTFNLSLLVSGGTPIFSYDVATDPLHGAAEVIGSTLTYTPNAAYRGTDSLIFEVTDQSDPVQTESATIAILVTAPELVVTGTSGSVTAGQSATFDLTTHITGGTGPFTVTIDLNGAKGTASVVGLIVTFAADAAERGDDTVVFRVTDVSDPVQSVTGEIDIHINAPTLVVSDSTSSVEAGLSVDIDLTSLIRGGTGPFTLTFDDEGTKGTVTSTGLIVHYLANATDRGADIVVFRITDESDPVQTTTVEIDITITAPVLAISPTFLQVVAGDVLTVDLSTLVSGGTLDFSYAVTTDPTHGTFDLVGTILTYTPDLAYRGTDPVGFEVTDESNPVQTKPGTVSILVTAPQLVVGSTSATVIAGQSVAVDLTSLISGGTGPFTVSFDDDGTKGIATASGLIVNFAANSADRGADTVVFRITDSSDPVQSLTGEIEISISAPTLVVVGSSGSVAVGDTLTFDLSTLVSGGTPNFAYSLTSDPAEGTFDLTGSILSYTADANYRGLDGFTFEVVDDSDPVQSGSATVSITVTDPPPTATDVPPTSTATAVPPTEEPTTGSTSEPSTSDVVVTITTSNGGPIPDGTQVCLGDQCISLDDVVSAAAASGTQVTFTGVAPGTYLLSVTINGRQVYAEEVSIVAGGSNAFAIVVPGGDATPDPVDPDPSNPPPVISLPSTGAGSTGSWSLYLIILAGAGLIAGAGVATWRQCRAAITIR